MLLAASQLPPLSSFNFYMAGRGGVGGVTTAGANQYVKVKGGESGRSTALLS